MAETEEVKVSEARDKTSLRLMKEEMLRLKEVASRETSKTGYLVCVSDIMRKWILDGLTAYEKREGIKRGK